MKFRIHLPIKYKPVVKKLAGDLEISMSKLIEMLLVLYIREFHNEYWDNVKEELRK